MIAASAEPLTDEQRDLVAGGAALAKWLGRRFAFECGRYDREAEFVDAAYQGLFKAARKFDGSLEVRFHTFASIKIRMAMLDMLRGRRLPSRQVDVAGLGELDLLVDDRRPGPEADWEQAEARAHVLRHLTHEESAIIDGHYFGGRGIGEIGRALGVERTRASHIHMTALAKLRRRGDELRALCGR